MGRRHEHLTQFRCMSRSCARYLTHPRRKGLPNHSSLRVNPGYLIALRPEQLDSVRFGVLAVEGRNALAAGAPEVALDKLREALGLWRGEALADFRHYQFAQSETARLEELRIQAIEMRLEAELELGHAAELVGELEALAAQFPVRERLRGQLMLALYRAGRQADALEAYRAARRHLVEHLGLEPGEELRELEREILSGGAGLKGTHLAAVAATPVRPPGNLSSPLTSFVGRRSELAELKRLLELARLVTVTGMGGAGKTRLALQVAGEVAEHYEDGVWLAELGDIHDPALVPVAIASALDLQETPDRPVEETLVEALRLRSMLLILDNCEHVIEPCAALAEKLVSRCTNLTLLCTSRETLGVAGEVAWQLPPLITPDPTDPMPFERLEEWDSVQLFVRRARAAVPSWRLTEENARWVTEICAQAEGIPLAIELAAARVKVMTVEEVARRLDDKLGFLTAGARRAPSRHKTLRSAVDWSYNLLSEPERRLLARVSIFAGGFTLEAAEAVCSGYGIPNEGVVDVLTAVVNKSMVQVDEAREGTRFRVLETIAQYARERLAELGEEGRLLARHASFFRALAEEAEVELHREDQFLWWRRLQAEHDNLRKAFKWAAERGQAETALTITGSLWWFWGAFPAEGRRLVSQALALPGAHRAPARARALVAAASLAFLHGDYDDAAERSEAALAVGRKLGDERLIAAATIWLGSIARDRGSYGRALTLHEQGLALSRKSGDLWLTARSLYSLALLSNTRGAYANSMEPLQEALALFERLGDNEGAAEATGLLGQILSQQGEWDTAAKMFERSLKLAGELDDLESTGWCSAALGAVAIHNGDGDQAEAMFRTALNSFRTLDMKLGIAHSLEGMAMIACLRRNVEKAVLLFGFSERLRETMGIPLSHKDQLLHDAHVERLHRELEPDRFGELWTRGSFAASRRCLHLGAGRGVEDLPVGGRRKRSQALKHQLILT